MVVFDDDPDRLVQKKIIDMLDQEYKDIDTKELINEWFISVP